METLGEWYRDNVLNQPDIVEVELPWGNGEVRIEREIFGWRLYNGKKYIECSTEEEARYLKVFLDIGQPRIRMPKNLEYLKKILPDLELVKNKSDQVISDHLDGILNSRTRQKLFDLIWYKLMLPGFEAEEKLDGIGEGVE
ncbi:MAG: hypothetical protein ACTSWW_08590 [Promethearchaeota archaeon]